MSDPKFNLRIKGGSLSVAIQPFPGVNREHWFTHDFGDEIVATAMRLLIEQQLSERISRIRRNAYNAGFKAGRGKRQKDDYFSGCINYPGKD
jgi:hypothetical protein